MSSGVGGGGSSGGGTGKAIMSSRKARNTEEGVCTSCDCEEFLASIFADAVCRCGHNLKKHHMDKEGDVAISTADLERDIETIKELGQGANGTVFKAKHKPSGKIIALKRVKIANDAMLHDMQKEISIMNNCDSENIVDFYGSYVDRKEVWIAMEYCSGGSLTKLMERRGRAYTEEEASVIVRNVLKALVYMHMSRRCHRDIKPENILLSGRGVPKLADFGISVQMGKGIQQMATLIGTPIFLAPEIITSDGYNCFPERDHQLLTNRGFMFCHELLAAIDCERDAAGRPLVRRGGIVAVRDWRGVRLATYDAAARALVYEQPLALVYNAPGAAKAPLVQFTSVAEAARWCDDDGADAPAADAGLSVVATPLHDMYVRLGAKQPLCKMTAEAVAAADADAVHFVTRAAAGLAADENAMAVDDDEPAFLEALALRAGDATAFLEFYGVWLGATGGRVAADAVELALDDDAQRAFAAQRLAALRGVAWHCAGRVLRVTSPLWVAYFRAQYGHAFGVAAAAEVPQRFDAVSWSGGSFLEATDAGAKWCWAWVWRLDAAALRALLRGVGVAMPQLTTRSARFRDELLRVLLHAGYAAHFVGAGAGAWALRFSECDEQVLRRGDGAARALSDGEMQPYRSGATWCCTMSRGFVVTRRARVSKRDGAVVLASQPTVQGNTKVDVWALGISLIILCDGAPPYGDVDPVRAMFVISQSKESPTLAHPAEWSKELNDFVACCLHRKPTDRWSSIELLSHPYMAQYAHVRTVSTSVRHDKVQTVPSPGQVADDAIAASAAEAAASNTAAAAAIAAAAAVANGAPALPDDDGLTRSDGKTRRRPSDRSQVDETADVADKDKEKKEKDRRERKEREEREERERKEKKEREDRDEKEREEKKERERKEKKEREDREEKERERKEKKEREEREEKERERREKKEREEREEKEREERKERERKEKKEREEREEKERERKEKKEREEREEKERKDREKEDEDKKKSRSKASDTMTRHNSDERKATEPKKSRSGDEDVKKSRGDEEDDDSGSSGKGGKSRRHRRTATPATADDGGADEDSASSNKPAESKRRHQKELLKSNSKTEAPAPSPAPAPSSRKQVSAFDALVKAEAAKKRDDDPPSPRSSKSTVSPRPRESPRLSAGGDAAPATRPRSSSDADKPVAASDRPAGAAPVPKPAGAAPRPKAPAPAPPGGTVAVASPTPAATGGTKASTRARADSLSRKGPAGAMATAVNDDDDEERERLEWERILAEEREKAKKKAEKAKK